MIVLAVDGEISIAEGDIAGIRDTFGPHGSCRHRLKRRQAAAIPINLERNCHTPLSGVDKPFPDDIFVAN
jgi:hypothetical protein